VQLLRLQREQRARPARPAARAAARAGGRVAGGGLGRRGLLARELAVALRQRDERGREAPAGAPDAGPVATPAPPQDVAKVREKVESLIVASRQAGFGYAADNLEHWYRGSGKPRVMPAAAFVGEQFLVNHLRERHKPRFARGAEQRLRNGTLKPGGSATMTWTDSISAPPDRELFYALGGFTVASTVTVSAVPFPGDPTSVLVTITSWRVKYSDQYEFDPGKTAFIPGFGTIPDSEMDQLRAAGLAANYPVESEPIDVLRLAGAGPFAFSVPAGAQP
jgi:hypothetical protein